MRYSPGRRRALVAGIVLVAGLGACSNRELYEAMQASQRSACERLADEPRARCLEEARMSYEDYERERKRAAAGPP